MNPVTPMIAGLVITGALLFSCRSAKPVAANLSKPANPVIAHRGAFKKNGFPENSLASLREAIRLGCSGSEFDVRMSADDSLVINHDPAYRKMDIEKTTYKELTALPLSNGEKLPTLQEYLLEGNKNNTGQLIADKVVALIKSLNMQNKVAYISFDYEICKRIHAIDSKAHTQYLNGDKTPLELKQDGIDGADYNYTVFQKNPGWIQMAHNAGIVLNAWTANDPAIMDWLLSSGFQYITTNEPEALFEKIKPKK
jgi:glycerophosphoryl diester phosphodiesterase